MNHSSEAATIANSAITKALVGLLISKWLISPSEAKALMQAAKEVAYSAAPELEIEVDEVLADTFRG